MLLIMGQHTIEKVSHVETQEIVIVIFISICKRVQDYFVIIYNINSIITIITILQLGRYTIFVAGCVTYDENPCGYKFSE